MLFWGFIENKKYEFIYFGSIRVSLESSFKSGFSEITEQIS